MNEFLTAADAARVLQVTPAAVRAMHRRGALQAAAKTEGGIHLFTRKEVEELAREREQQRDRTKKE